MTSTAPTGTVFKRLRRAASGGPSRQFLLTACVLSPLMLASATWSYVFEFGSWRADVMQAADRAGLYLFFVSPAYAAMTCWSASRARANLGEIADTLPAPGLVWRCVWWPYCVFGVTFHAAVLAATTATALVSGGVGSVDPFPVLVQFLSIAFFCALGALVGGLARSDLAPPALILGLLALNTVLVRYGFRRISDVGTGSADFVDLRMNPAYLMPKALLFVFLPMFALPWPLLAVGPRRHLQSAAGAGAAALALSVLFHPTVPQQYVPGPTSCHGSGKVQVCVPEVLARRARELDVPVARTTEVLTRLGLPTPGRLDAISRGATYLSGAGFTFPVTAQDFTVPGRLQRQVNLAFAQPLHCDDVTSPLAPPPNVVETRAVLAGWLARRTGAPIESAAYPSGAVQRLEALPEREQHSIVATLFRAVWSCDTNVQPPQ